MINFGRSCEAQLNSLADSLESGAQDDSAVQEDSAAQEDSEDPPSDLSPAPPARAGLPALAILGAGGAGGMWDYLEAHPDSAARVQGEMQGVSLLQGKAGLEEGGEEIARGGRRLSACKGEARLEEGFGAHLDRRVIEEVKLSALLYTSDHPAEFG